MILRPVVTWKDWPYGVILVLFLCLFVEQIRIRHLESTVVRVTLRADSAEAAADVTHRVAVKALGDTAVVWYRRVIQERQRADELDKQLKLERIAKLHGQITVHSVDTVVVGATTVDTQDVRHAAFVRDEPPFHVRALVTVPRPPLESSMQLGIRLDTLALGLRLSCGKAKDGIRPAEVIAVAPPWATVTFDAVSQSPDLCASPALQKHGPSRTTWFFIGAGSAIAAKLLIGALVK